ncbi:hypothetical protein [Xenorhabdus innexi]|uniref:Uncharacterized protein n=1 Tax=Xenorhabdus innexi TaxID=290109 RepID=A0A1N6MSV6_9GAMM|nr:hypothetical protein [Xenorhabdus innexi]PHM30371.1 hypothetical protein Xinn_03305 [Xenorhabdus innexi]SIP71938.1 conserved hypothetical protein [Xenorhabdus innexi]
MIVFNAKNYLLGRKSKLVTLFIIFFSVLYLYKKETSIVEKIFDYTDKYCRVNEECVVNMTNVTQFEWDYMYVVDNRQSHKSVESFINLKIDMNLDFFQHIFFTKDNKFVHQEGYFYYSDSTDRRGLMLNFDHYKKGMRPITHYVISKENPNILIKKEIVPNHKDYYWFSYANEKQVVRVDWINTSSAED